MLCGEMHNPDTDAQLMGERKVCLDRLFEYNNIPATNFEARKKAIHGILGKAGEMITVVSPFFCDYGYNIEVGENFFANTNCAMLDGGKITIGDNCFIGPNCGFYTPSHPEDSQLRSEGWEYTRPITVGNDVWFGGNVCVLPGVTIGDNVIIGAGSVVTKDIPSNSVAVGNPCRVIRKLK